MRSDPDLHPGGLDLRLTFWLRGPSICSTPPDAFSCRSATSECKGAVIYYSQGFWAKEHQVAEVLAAGYRAYLLDKTPGGRDHYYMRANDISIPSSADQTCQVPCFKPELVNRLRDRLPSDERLEECQILFGALADCTRLKLLLSLRNGEELCVCDVAHVLGVSISSASHHLRKLRDLRILRSRNDGKMSYYSLRDAVVASLLDQVFPPVKASKPCKVGASHG